MLGDKNSLQIKYDNKEKDLYLNYQFLKNLFKLTNQNPFYFLQDFMLSSKKDDYLGRIIYCMLNGAIKISDIYEIILGDEETKVVIMFNLINLISMELSSEYKELDEDLKENKNEETKVEKSEADKINDFIQYWNNSYYIATIQLKMSEDEFYNISPRELKTLDKHNSNYSKNILIDTYITVMKAQNSDDNNDKDIKTNVRFKDLF